MRFDWGQPVPDELVAIAIVFFSLCGLAFFCAFTAACAV